MHLILLASLLLTPAHGFLQAPTLPPSQVLQARSPFGGGDEGPPGLAAPEDPGRLTTADHYLEMLKVDSRERLASMAVGDEDAANKPFASESVAEMQARGPAGRYNPGGGEEVVKSDFDAETTEEIRRAFMRGPEKVAGEVGKIATLSEMLGGGAGAAAPAAAAATPAPPASPAATTPVPVRPPAVAPAAPPVPVRSPVASQPTPAPVRAPIQAPSTPPPVQVPSAPPRELVRTAQALLLKHRGGPGFGAGVLGAEEAKRLGGALEELRAHVSAAPVALSAPAPALSASPLPPPTPPPVPAAPLARSRMRLPLVPVAAAPPASYSSALVCASSALSMFASSPQPALLPAVRTALSLVLPLLPPPPSPPAAGELDGATKCAAAAIEMLQNAPPSARDALEPIVAVAICNAIASIEGGEGGGEGGVFAEARDVLSMARGGGALGLRDGMGEDEKEEVRNVLVRVRGAVLDEME